MKGKACSDLTTFGIVNINNRKYSTCQELIGASTKKEDMRETRAL